MVKAELRDRLIEIPYTPVEEAIKILHERRKDRALVARIETELGGDIPSYLHEGDCFVLPRHIATPNNEALYVLGSRLIQSQNAMVVASATADRKFAASLS